MTDTSTPAQESGTAWPAGLPPRPVDWAERCYALGFSAAGSLSWETLAAFDRGRPAEDNHNAPEATS